MELIGTDLIGTPSNPYTMTERVAAAVNGHAIGCAYLAERGIGQQTTALCREVLGACESIRETEA